METESDSNINRHGHNKKKLSDSAQSIGSVCFLLGSLLFTADGIGWCFESLSYHALLYTFGSLLFAVGSAFTLF